MKSEPKIRKILFDARAEQDKLVEAINKELRLPVNVRDKKFSEYSFKLIDNYSTEIVLLNRILNDT